MAPPPVPGPKPITDADLEALNVRMDTLIRHTAILVTKAVKTEVAEKAVPREELRRRLRASGKRTIAGLVLVVLLLVGAVALNRYTLIQAQRDLNNQVVTCFLRPGAITPAQSAACGRRFGPEYARLQQRSAQANARFTSLQEWARSQGWKPPK